MWEFKKLHIHHLTYDRLYVERLDDLKVLCETCHMKAHGNISKEKSAKNKKRIENRVKLVKKGVAKKYDRNHYFYSTINGVVISIKKRMKLKNPNSYLKVINEVADKRLETGVLTRLKIDGSIKITKGKRILNKEQINALNYIKENQDDTLKMIKKLIK